MICTKVFTIQCMCFENVSFLHQVHSSNFFPLPIQVLSTSDNLFLGDEKMIFLLLKMIFSSPKNKLSAVNKTYIDISTGQKFELKLPNTYLWSMDYSSLSSQINEVLILSGENFINQSRQSSCKKFLTWSILCLNLNLACKQISYNIFFSFLFQMNPD